MTQNILVTGTAGFIGFHLATRLLDRGDRVVGIDSINDYYDVALKYGRLAQAGIDMQTVSYAVPAQSSRYPEYTFMKLDINDKKHLDQLFEECRFDRVCHLAAQAGVRYSLSHPYAYIEANIDGFMNILEACRHYPVQHLSYASTSSIYGLNTKMPFSTHANADHPVSLYAATKKSNELMAHTYSHLYDIPTTGLRFFTVYGPWGRPDMALFIFTKAILEGRPIEVFNNGDMERDFTYIDDIVEGVVRVIDAPPAGNAAWDSSAPDPASSAVPYKIYNIGNSRPVRLMDFIEAIEEELGKKAEKNMLPIQPGDVPATWADVDDLQQDLGYTPSTPISVGVKRFVEWYRSFYGV